MGNALSLIHFPINDMNIKKKYFRWKDYYNFLKLVYCYTLDFRSMADMFRQLELEIKHQENINRIFR